MSSVVNLKTIYLLFIGTFLEYFDLMLYVHMSVLLNELFFPKTTPENAAYLSAFSFCLSFVFRPFGALIFGKIGDKYGRKFTIIITTFMMSISCGMMFFVPTYAKIGIMASWIVGLARVIQSISSMGEIVGAKLYLTEIIEPPLQYPIVTIIQVAAAFGGVISLVIAVFINMFGLEWRYAFLLGATIAVIGAYSRRTLRESPDFVDAKKRVEKYLKAKNEDITIVTHSTLWHEKVNWKTVMATCLMDCMWPICFYFSYNYCSTILKTMGYSPQEIIYNNLFVSLFDFVGIGLLAYLSYYIYPLTILRIRFFMFSVLILTCIYVLCEAHITMFHIFCIQASVIFLGLNPNPASAIIFKYFPILKRFTVIAWTFAISRSLMYIIISFGMTYLNNKFNHGGLLIIIIPFLIAFYWGLHHFIKLEEESSLSK